MFRYRLPDLVAAASAQLTGSLNRVVEGLAIPLICERPQRRTRSEDERDPTYRCANLDEILAHWLPVIHRIESGDLVHSHRRHFQDARHLVHDANARVPMLPLTQV